MEGVAGLLPFVLIFVVFWFFLIRPQRKRQLELQQTQRGIGVGDQVLLGAGILGTVAGTDEEYVHLEVSPGVVVKAARAAVVRVVERVERPEELLAPEDQIPPRTDEQP